MKVDLASDGEKLNVQTVLEGRVRKTGNRLRTTAQLIKVSDGYHLWSERFDRDLTDVFEVQDEIAKAIASKLRVSLNRSGDLVKPPTKDVRAYELFLKGRQLYYLPGWQLAKAITLFEQALELDDQFALAYAALAEALALSGYYGLAMPADIIERSHAAALRAVELAPQTADAHHSVALWQTFYGGDRHAAVVEWDKVAAGTGFRTQVRCSYALFGLGLMSDRWDDGVKEIQSAIEDDPLNGFAHAMLAMLKTFARQINDVVAFARRGVELDPESFWTQLAFQRALHCAGMHQEAQQQGLYLLEISGRHPWALAELAVDYASVGDRAGAEAIYEELMVRGRVKHLQPSPLALAAVAAGRLDDAIAHCERAIAEKDAHILWGVREVWDGWEKLYQHPRWKDVRKGVFTWRPQAAR
jgi:serine/threonine-protein kinase